jgi:hypothetical protein
MNYYQEWAKNNKEKIKEYHKKYYSENKEKYKENAKKYFLTERARKMRSERRQKYRAEKRPYENRNLYRKEEMERGQKNKALVILKYGGVCVCCNESNKKFLTIDHINDDGKTHKDNGKTRLKGMRLYTWIIKNEFPNDLRILCFNCNIGRRNNKGECPHKEIVPC